MEYVQAHWQDILTIVAYVVSAASAIAALTPTQSDNKVIDQIIKVLDTLGLNIANRNPRQ